MCKSRIDLHIEDNPRARRHPLAYVHRSPLAILRVRSRNSPRQPPACSRQPFRPSGKNISTMSTAPFGVGGKPRKPRPLVDTSARICVYDIPGAAIAPLGPLAREITVDINGMETVIEVVCDARFLGGDGQQYFLCPHCSRKVWHLYVRDERLACRQCSGLDYASRHTRRRGLHRVRNLRHRLGALPSPLAPLPPRPKYWRRDHWARAVAALVVAEAMVAAELRAMIPRVRRRLNRDRHSNPGA